MRCVIAKCLTPSVKLAINITLVKITTSPSYTLGISEKAGLSPQIREDVTVTVDEAYATAELVGVDVLDREVGLVPDEFSSGDTELVDVEAEPVDIETGLVDVEAELVDIEAGLVDVQAVLVDV